MKWKVKALVGAHNETNEGRKGKNFRRKFKCYKSHRRNIYTFLASWMFYLYIRLCYVTSTGTVFFCVDKKNVQQKLWIPTLSSLEISGPLSKLIQSHHNSRMAICFPSPLSLCRWASCYVTWNLKVGLSSRKGNCVCTQKSCLKKSKTFLARGRKSSAFSSFSLNRYQKTYNENTQK